MVLHVDHLRNLFYIHVNGSSNFAHQNKTILMNIVKVIVLEFDIKASLRKDFVFNTLQMKNAVGFCTFDIDINIF